MIVPMVMYDSFMMTYDTVMYDSLMMFYNSPMVMFDP